MTTRNPWREATEQEAAARRPAAGDRLAMTTVEGLCSRPRQQWRVRNLLPVRGLGVIYGEPSSGKTFAALDLAAAVCRGAPWMGARTRAGGVVYVACEGALRNRLEAYLHHRQLSVEALARLRVIESGINLLDGSGDTALLIDRVKQASAEIGGVAMVVIDTLNRAMPGGNENGSEDMGAIIAAAGRITEATGALVIFVHHCGKDVARGSRGHSSLKGAADVEILVTCGDRAARCVEVTKVKDGESGQRYGFRLVGVDLGPSDDPEADPGERITSCAVEASEAVPKASKQPRKDVALDALREAIQDVGERMPGTSSIPPGVVAVTLEQWERRYRLRTGDDYSNDESAKAAFRRERGKLLAAEKVQCSGKLVWML